MRKTFLFFIVMLFVSAKTIFCAQPWPGVTNPQKTNMNTFMHTGFTFPAVLQTGIFSYNIETPVIACAEYDITFLDKTVIPKGTKFIGTTSIVKTIDRVNVTFQTAVFPDGTEIRFFGFALNKDGSAGIPGKVSKQKAAFIPARVML